MNRSILLLPLAALLSSCAAPTGPMATCTNLVSVGGGLIQFCQTADKIKVSEAGVDLSKSGTEVKIVDDPIVLASLERDLRTSTGFTRSRHLVARACLVKGQNYISIAMTDLKRIIAEKGASSPKIIGLRNIEDEPRIAHNAMN